MTTERPRPRLTRRVREIIGGKMMPKVDREAPIGLIIPLPPEPSTADYVRAGEARAVAAGGVAYDAFQAEENELLMRTRLSAIFTPYQDGVNNFAQDVHIKLRPS